MTAVKHPARFSDRILEVGADLIRDQLGHGRWPHRPIHVLDPFAGTGRVHELHRLLAFDLRTQGVELEPEWAAMHQRTRVGDATRLPRSWTGRFSVVFTSPCYGNRMADHHEAQDASRRRSYRHDLGRMPSVGSSATLQWGDDYRELHERAWAEVHRVLIPARSSRGRGGLFVLNVKDHVRQGERQHVTRWHRQTIEELGFQLVATRRIKHAGMGFGENRDARVPHETVYAFRKRP